MHTPNSPISNVPTITLNDGARIPAVGFGTYPMDNEEAEAAVMSAIDLGYRLIDTATNYGNEIGVGRALAQTEIPRDELFITTKLPGRDQGYDETRRSFEESIQRLSLEYVDLYLIHWPNPRVDKYLASWKAMIELREEGVIRSIGVSNFTAPQLQRLKNETGVVPAVNQLEVHPSFQQEAMWQVDHDLGVLTEAWSPLGRGGDIIEIDAIQQIAAAHDVSPVQVILRWHVQRGVVPIPKSATPARQRANLDLFGFSLDADEMAAIAALDKGAAGRRGGDPDTHEEF